MKIYDKIKDTIKQLEDLENNNNEKTDCKFREGYGCAIDETIELVKKLVEPRFLLEKDSICYGCEYYKHIEDVICFEEIYEDDVDENCGVCDCSETIEQCIFGSLNSYKGE